MTDIPMLCTPAAVRAMLEGRQTQDRRLAWSTRKDPADDKLTIRVASTWQKVQPGDRLYVREPIRILTMNVDGQRGPKSTDILYAADDDETGTWHTIDWRQRADLQDAEVPATHMPRAASRLTLTVTKVLGGYLQDITDEDAIASGIVWTPGIAWTCSAERGVTTAYRSLFADEWDGIYPSPNRWADNPEVIALTFTVAWHNNDKAPPHG